MQATHSPQPTETVEEIRNLAAQDMADVNILIRESLKSDVLLVSQVSEHIVSSGGKRLRPLLVLLASRALGYNGNQQIHAAAIIEFIHTATLLHDDVVDSSDRRRGQDTANIVFGNQTSVLVGDFLYSRAFQLMVEIGNMKIMQILADSTNMIAAGEVMQLMNVHDPDVSEADYLEVIYRKTARLFEAGAQIAAVLAQRNPDDELHMIEYGKNLGTAFQLVDDALDYDASSDEIGKNIGDDLAEGKPTLPLIHAMEKASPAAKIKLRDAILSGGLEQLDAIQEIVRDSGSLTYTLDRANKAASDAINALQSIPETEYKQALINIAEYSVRRRV